MSSKRPEKHLPPHDGVHPLKAFDILNNHLAARCADAGVGNIRLEAALAGSDDIAEVLDELCDFPHTGLTVSFCEIEGKSLAARLLTPGYSLTWVAPAPNDPQDGDDSVEAGEFYRAYEVAAQIVREIVNYRMARESKRCAYEDIYE